MSQLTSRGLDNTSYAFVSDIYIYIFLPKTDKSVASFDRGKSL